MNLIKVQLLLILVFLVSCSSEEDVKNVSSSGFQTVEENQVILGGQEYKVRSIQGIPRAFDAMKMANSDLFVVQLAARRVLRFNENYEFVKWIGVSPSAKLTEEWQPASIYTSETSSPESYGVPHALLHDSRWQGEFAVVFYDTQASKNANTLMKFDFDKGKFQGSFGLISNNDFSSGYTFENKIPLGENYFQGIVAVSQDSANNTYVVDAKKCQITKFDSSMIFQGWIGMGVDDKPVAKWKKVGTSKCSSLAGGFVNPHSVAIDQKANLYVADFGNNRVQKFNSSGNFLGWIGAKKGGGITSGWSTTGEAVASSLQGGFNQPIALRLDANDNLYVLENEGNRLQKLSSAGAPQWKLEGLNKPCGFQWYENEFIVLDTGNNRVLIYSKN